MSKKSVYFKFKKGRGALVLLIASITGNKKINSNNNIVNTMSSIIYHENYPPPWRPLLILVFPLLPIFWTYQITITDTTISFGYSYAAKTIDLSDITSATTIDHVNGLRNWGGWGIRFNLSGETGYICKNGSAVKIAVKVLDKNGGEKEQKIYVFNCDEASRVCHILNGDKD